MSPSYGKCDRIVFQLKDAASFYKLIPEAKKSIIPNPYLSSFNYFPPEAQNRKKIIVMAAARLEYEKGFDLGFRALSLVLNKHPEYEIFVYGAGNHELMYGRLLDELNIRNKVFFKGLSSQVIQDIYQNSVFLLPSRSEGIPNMLIEAMGAGMPCVAFDCPPGGPRFLFGDNNERGILVALNDCDTMADMVNMLLEDRSLMDMYSSAAQDIIKLIDPSKIENLWINTFKKTLKEE